MSTFTYPQARGTPGRPQAVRACAALARMRASVLPDWLLAVRRVRSCTCALPAQATLTA